MLSGLDFRDYPTPIVKPRQTFMLFAYPTGVQASTNSRVAIERGRSRRAILASKNFEFARQSSESNQCNGAARGA